MNTDLHSQLNEYGTYHRQVQAPVGFDELTASGESVRPVPLFPSPRPKPLRRGLVAAIAAAAIVLVAVGFIPFLISRERDSEPVGTVLPTTSVPSVASTEAAPPVDNSVPTDTTLSSAEADPGIDLSSLDLPLITEHTVSSSIGDVVLRIFASTGEEESFEAMQAIGASRPAPTDPDPDLDPSLTGNDIFVVDSLAIDIWTGPLGSIGDSYLTGWSFRFNPQDTALMADPGLIDRSSNGRLLGLGDVTGGTIEVALYGNERDADLSDEKPSAVESDPVEIVANYRLDATQGEDGTLLRVFDAENGNLIGTVTAAINLDPGYDLSWGFPLVRRGEYYSSPVQPVPLITLSGGGAIEHVTPDWAGGDLDAIVSTGEKILVYIGTVEVWQTYDGQTWTNMGPPTGWPAGYAEPQISYQDGLFLVDLNDQIGGRADNVYLNSPNGIDWVPAGTLPPGNGKLVRVDSGFAWAGSQEVELWTSPDGIAWEMIDLSGLNLPLNGLLGNGTFVKGLWFHQAEELDRLWTVEFAGG